MRKRSSIFLLTIIVFLSSTTSALCQSTRRLAELFGRRQYGELVASCKQMIADKPTFSYPYAMLGSVYAMESKFDSSVYFSQKAIEIDNDSTYVSCWAYLNGGFSNIYLGNRDVAIQQLNRCIVLGSSTQRIDRAKEILDSIKYKYVEQIYEKDYLPNWVCFEKEHIIYRFQDTAGLTNFVYKFMSRHDSTYVILNKIFEAKLPGKVIIHSWNDEEKGKAIVHFHQLGFAKPKGCFTHVFKDHAVAHEMTHILSYWSWGMPNTGFSKFINEGTARCFDQEDYDKYAAARVVAQKKKIGSVLDVWSRDKEGNKNKSGNAVVYVIGGAFVTYLYELSTPEEFKQLVKQQTLEKARVIYGDRFNKIITDFDHLMGMKG